MLRMRPNPTFGALALLAILHLSLYLTLQMRAGVTGVVLWYVGPPLLAAMALVLLLCVLVSAARGRMLWTWTRGAQLMLLAGLSAAPTLYRTYPSSNDGRPSAVRFTLPLSGPVTVAWGGKASAVNAHVVAPDQRWGYDLIITFNGKSFRGDGQSVTDYFVYGHDVLAPTEGIVHDARDGEADASIGRRGRGDDLGNHVALRVAPHEFLYIAHLQPGSIAVKRGDAVRAGQRLGRVGNSGITSEPHIHMHLQDSARRHLAEGIPFHFSSYCHAGGYVEHGMPTGGRKGVLWTGQVVTQAVSRGCGTFARARAIDGC
jgi:hypothetical protein